MSTAEISELLGRISGLNVHQLPMYQQAVIDNNINGMVLTMCDLDDLGKCLQMKFGDWQLFKSAVQALRDAEVFLPGENSAHSIETAAVAPQKARPSLDSNRSIHFSKAEASEKIKRSDIEDSGEQSKRTHVFKRQSSIDAQKEGVSISVAAFDTIKEETETSKMAEQGKLIKRNDSFVEQAMYESGLLHDFVHTFTEAVSEGDESEEDKIEEVEVDIESEVADLNASCASIVKKKPPVQFQLSQSSKEGDDGQPEEAESEEEPLIQTKKSDTSTTSTPTKNIFKSSTPILKLPVLKTPENFENLTPNTQSFPDFTSVQESEVTVHQELQPLIPVPKRPSTCSSLSTGFPVTDLPSDSERVTAKSTESFEMLSVVDETRQSARAEGSKAQCLEESIEQYTRQSLSRDAKHGSSVLQSDDNTRIQMKGLQKDKNTPESFV